VEAESSASNVNTFSCRPLARPASVTEVAGALPVDGAFVGVVTNDEAAAEEAPEADFDEMGMLEKATDEATDGFGGSAAEEDADGAAAEAFPENAAAEEADGTGIATVPMEATDGAFGVKAAADEATDRTTDEAAEEADGAAMETTEAEAGAMEMKMAEATELGVANCANGAGAAVPIGILPVMLMLILSWPGSAMGIIWIAGS
jgi:hypothetical protein